MQEQSMHRIFQLSYLRALVTLLMVVHHSALAHVRFKLPGHGFTTAIPVTDASKWSGFDVFVGWTDVFFMALMLFVSSLFVWPGLRRHGVGAYLKRPFLRLGVPFVIAAALLAPLTYYPAYLQFSGNVHLGSYAHAWLALGVWPAGICGMDLLRHKPPRRQVDNRNAVHHARPSDALERTQTSNTSRLEEAAYCAPPSFVQALNRC